MMELWRVKTVKQIDDDPTIYVAMNIDYILNSLEDALEEAQRRLEDEVVVEVSISKEEMSEKWEKLYGKN